MALLLAENIRNADENKSEQFELKKIFEKPMRTLNGGTRQKVKAAVSFLFDPQILISKRKLVVKESIDRVILCLIRKESQPPVASGR